MRADIMTYCKTCLDVMPFFLSAMRKDTVAPIILWEETERHGNEQPPWRRKRQMRERTRKPHGREGSYWIPVNVYGLYLPDAL
eukprot:3713169-Amphidinium_carterae.1